MKRLFRACATVLGLAVVSLFVLASIDFNRLGKEHFYVQIVGEGKEKQFKSESGAIYKTYWYTLPAYDDEGNEVELTFSASKQLRAQTYLKLYMKNGTEITSYDEIQYNDLPVAVKEKYVK